MEASSCTASSSGRGASAGLNLNTTAAMIQSSHARIRGQQGNEQSLAPHEASKPREALGARERVPQPPSHPKGGAVPVWAPPRCPGKKELASTVRRQRGLTIMLASTEGAGPKFERECKEMLKNEVISPPELGRGCLRDVPG